VFLLGRALLFVYGNIYMFYTCIGFAVNCDVTVQNVKLLHDNSDGIPIFVFFVKRPSLSGLVSLKQHALYSVDHYKIF